MVSQFICDTDRTEEWKKVRGFLFLKLTQCKHKRVSLSMLSKAGQVRTIKNCICKCSYLSGTENGNGSCFSPSCGYCAAKHCDNLAVFQLNLFTISSGKRVREDRVWIWKACLMKCWVSSWKKQIRKSTLKITPHYTGIGLNPRMYKWAKYHRTGQPFWPTYIKSFIHEQMIASCIYIFLKALAA